MRNFTLTAVLLLACGALFSQPITSYPYFEDFESFFNGPTGAAAVAEPNPNAFPGDWANEITNDGAQDWYSVSGPTPSGSTGPVGDHTTGSGIYMYVEDSQTDNDEVTLESPLFALSALTNPSLSFWVNSDANIAGAFYGGDSSFNHLLVDYFDGTTWIRLDSIGVLNTGWTLRQIPLIGISPFARFRFVVNNNNFGDFVHDIAIDDVSVFDIPTDDISLEVGELYLNLPGEYTLAPVSQAPNYELGAIIRNNGLNTMTNVKVAANFGTFADTVSLDSLVSFQDSMVLFNATLDPMMGGDVKYSVFGDQTDTFPNNEYFTRLNDTTFARDDSSASGGIGFTGATGIFGTMYELTQPDVLTSISYFLESSTIGDTIRLLMYGFGNDVAGFPDTTSVMDSTGYFPITSLGWQTSTFTCQNLLAPGQYFIAVEQVSTINLGFGYDLDNYVPNTSFFGDGIGQWTELGSIPTLASSFMIRMNFGAETKTTSLAVSADRICLGDTVSLFASGTGTFSWIGTNLLTTAGDTVRAVPDSSSAYAVTLVDADGCSSIAESVVDVNPLPTPSITGDTLVCENTAVTLTASGGGTYLWSTGETTADISPIPAGSTTYTVTVSDSIGCAAVDSFSVGNYPSSIVTFDSTIAFFGLANGTATATATNGTAPYTYLWATGATTAQATGLAAGVYSVEVTDANGCVTLDSVMVTEATAGIQDLLDESLISAFPNPSAGSVTLENLKVFGGNASLTITILDVQGRTILSETVTGQSTVNLTFPATAATGIYTLDIRSNDQRVVKRVILDK